MVNLPITYSEKQVTPFGGMSLMKRFVDQTGIWNFLKQLDLPHPGSNRGYVPEQSRILLVELMTLVSVKRMIQSVFIFFFVTSFFKCYSFLSVFSGLAKAALTDW